MGRFDIENFLFQNMGYKGTPYQMYLEILPECSYLEFLCSLNRCIREGRVIVENDFYSIGY